MDDTYLGLARKYRPQIFADVAGQDPTVTTLFKALASKRIANAYLFSGTRGTGKTTLARLLAKALNCSAPINNEPCNQCHFCMEITSGNHLDVIEIDGASHRGIDDIRELQETLRYPPTEAKYKIIIIDEVHMLTKEAFNALLKTLEEPPEHVKFLFATTELHKLPPTILSRCQRYQLRRISLDILVQRMTSILQKEYISFQTEALYFIAELAQGSLRDSLSLLDQICARCSGNILLEEVRSFFKYVPRRKLFEFDKAIAEQQLPSLLEISTEIFDGGIDLKDWITALAEHYRVYLHLLTRSSTELIKSLESWEIATYREMASHFSVGFCLDLLERLLDWQKKEILQQHTGYFELLHCDLMRAKGKIRLDQWLELKKGELKNLPPCNETQVEEKHNTLPTPPAKLPEPTITETSTETKVTAEITSDAKVSMPTSEIDKQRVETLLRFASVEMEGIIKKN